MKKHLTVKSTATIVLFFVCVISLTRCTSGGISEKQQYGGFESQVKWGEHLVTFGGCGDCHTPKKMTPMGPEDDSTLLLSGHPAQLPIPDFDRSIAESKGLFFS